MKVWRSARIILCISALGLGSLLAPMAATADVQDGTAEPAYTYADLTFANPSGVGESTATPQPGATPVTDDVRHGAFLGDLDAPVTLQIYADYQCPHCRNFHQSIEPPLIDDYVRAGEIRLEFLDFPVIGITSLHELTDDSKESVQAAEATMCAAEQNAYMPYREALYAGDLIPNSGALSDDNLVAVADDLGLDADALSTCLASGRYEEWIVTGSLAAFAQGVNKTPTLMINGEDIPLTTDGYDGLTIALDRALEHAA